MLGTPEAQVEGAPCCKENTPILWAMFTIPLQRTLELLSSMAPRPIQFPAFISQLPKDILATGPSSEPLLLEVTLIGSCLRITIISNDLHCDSFSQIIWVHSEKGTGKLFIKNQILYK